MQGYKLNFDVASGMRFEIWMLPLVILPLVGACLVFLPKTTSKLLPHPAQGSWRTAFSWFYFIFSSTISIVWIISHTGTYLQLRNSVVTNSVKTVEGCLQGFHPMPEGGHDTERLLVDGLSFSYSDYLATPGFNKTESHGGPIHADSRVRIGYFGPDIVKVETIDHACPHAPDIDAPNR